MTSDPRERLSYFAPSPSSPWRWTSDGGVLVWYDGSTVAFRPEIAVILRYLEPRGLPSFGSIVLVLAALKGKIPGGLWLDGPALLESLPLALEVNELRKSIRLRIEKNLDAFAGLAALSDRGPAALATPRGKAVLIETLLEREVQVLSPEEARTLVYDLSAGALEGKGWAKPSFRSPSRMLKDFETVAARWKHFDASRFETRLRTGLDALPDNADIETLSAAERARELLRELERHESLLSFAKLTRDLMAAIYLPTRLLPRDEAPIGGFADISNRGSLDRLLLSELAHDDLTLAVRVALNEALYVKREPPAEHPEGHFTLLIDTGLRMWGIPRVYAAAVALAFVAVQHRKRLVSAFRSQGDEVVEVDLLSQDGLMELLEALDTEVHPGPAIKAFREQLSPDDRNESVIITDADVLSDAEFRACLRRESFDVLHVASVSRSGEFRIVSYPSLDGRAVSSAVLDVSELLSPAKRPPMGLLLDLEHDAELPLIFAMKPLPFLLPVRGQVRKAVNRPSGDGACVTRDGRLLSWADRQHGARELAMLPKGETILLELTENAVFVVKAHGGSISITTIDRESGRLLTVDRKLSVKPCGVMYRPHAILLMSARGVEAIDPATAETLARVELNSMRWAQGRYFVGGEWQALSWDGDSLRFEPVSIEGTDRKDVLHVFDSASHEGPLAIIAGVGVRSAVGEDIVLGGVSSFAAISDDGCRIATEALRGGYLLFDLESRRVSASQVIPNAWLHARAEYVPTRTLRYRIRHLSRDDAGRLFLCTAKGQWLELSASHRALELFPCPVPQGLPAALTPVQGTRLAGQLMVASWEDGVRAFWDIRGMLHLKSGIWKLPEVSLLIGEREVAAWSSDGATCGPSFFFPRPSSETAAGMLERIHRVMRPKARSHRAPRKGLNSVRES
jgi:hypothetical protein